MIAEYDEKRDYVRMNVDYDIIYKPVDSKTIQTGRCTSLSAAGMAFITKEAYAGGLAMEVKVIPQNATTPDMTAFVEVVRCRLQKAGLFEVAATIKSLK